MEAVGVAEVGAAAGSTLDQSFVLQCAQRLGGGGARNAEPFYNLGLARQASTGGVFSRSDLAAQIPADVGVFRHGRNGKMRTAAVLAASSL